ncbi:unnamed protein product [Scytosiphon promiscuus]
MRAQQQQHYGSQQQHNSSAHHQQQRQQQQHHHHHHHHHGRPADTSDGSGGSDDFVLVDGTAASSDHGNVGDPASGNRPAGTGAGGRFQPPSRLAGEGDARSLGPRLVAAGGRWVWGGNGQAAFGLQHGLSAPGGARGGAAEAAPGGIGTTGVPPLSLEGVLRCLQIVELFGRRAVLLAELGDSRVAPAMRCRQRSSLEVNALTATGVWGTGDGRDDGKPGQPFAHPSGGDFCAFSQENRPLFPDADEPWLPSSSSLGGPTAFDGDSSSNCCHTPRGGGGGGGGGGPGASFSASNSVCCDSHRLFGEALVLYLKSLSMAKEAIIWGNQALESLPAPAAAAAAGTAHTSSATSPSSSYSSRHPQAQKQPPPPPPPPPQSPSPTSSPVPPRPLAPQAGSPLAPATASLDEVSGRGQQQRQEQQRQGSGRVGGGGATASGNAPPCSSAAAASLSSEAQVAARGSSLVRWLTGQFSTVLRRAERCRTELRGGESPSSSSPPPPPPPSEHAAGTLVAGAVAVDASMGPDTAETSAPGPVSGRLAGGGGGGGVGGFVAAPRPALSPGRSNYLVSTARGGGGGGGGSNGGAGLTPLGEGRGHGAVPAAVAVSARDIVVRAALAMAKESAASEVLGMWEPARKGYEKAALLLETLLLDALVSRPETPGSGLSRSAAGGAYSGGGGGGGNSGPVSPKAGWTAGVGGGGAGVNPGDSLIASGARGGILSEADQRVLQNYMTRFARRAAEVAGIERDEARAAAAEAAATASSESSAVYEEGSLELSVGSTDADACETGTQL